MTDSLERGIYYYKAFLSLWMIQFTIATLMLFSCVLLLAIHHVCVVLRHSTVSTVGSYRFYSHVFKM